jgi:glycosyltransferase involved in cell wall biosynthesis
VTVIPSIEQEAFGRASIEAQAMGCPVIVSSGGALPETVAEKGGWIAEAGSESALAERLGAVLQMPGEARALVAAAAQGNALSFSKTALQKKTLEVYDRLLASKMANAYAAADRVEEYAHHTA